LATAARLNGGALLLTVDRPVEQWPVHRMRAQLSEHGARPLAVAPRRSRMRATSSMAEHDVPVSR
jgi:hypothetical protein